MSRIMRSFIEASLTCSCMPRGAGTGGEEPLHDLKDLGSVLCSCMFAYLEHAASKPTNTEQYTICDD